MQAHVSVSLLDLLDLPDAQREILLYVTRNGPADGAALVTGLPTAEVEQTLEALVEMGRVRRPANGRLDTIAGRVRSRTALAAQSRHALLTTDRLCSAPNRTLQTRLPATQLEKGVRPLEAACYR